MHDHSPKSIRSKRASTPPGRPLIQHTGPKMAMLLFAVTRQESDSLPVVSIHFHAIRFRHSMQSSNGLPINTGHQARLACLVLAIMELPSGELQHETLGASLLSVPGKGLLTFIAISRDMEASSQTLPSIHGGINRSRQTSTACLAGQRAGGAQIQSRAISQVRNSLITGSIS